MFFVDLHGEGSIQKKNFIGVYIILVTLFTII